MKKYDLIVIGGGIAGYVGALKAAQFGKKIALFEEKELGGVCLNVGCVPTKILSAKACLFESIKIQTNNKVLKDAGLFSFKKIINNKNDVVNQLTEGVAYLLKSAKVDIFKNKAEIISANEVKSGSKTYKTEYILIATGTSNIQPDLFDPEHLTSDSTDILNLLTVPESMVIIGAGVIGLEMASIFNSFGTEVTIIELLPEILPDFDRDVVEIFQKELEAKGVKFSLDSEVNLIKKDENGKTVHFTDKKGNTRKCSAQIILSSIGRRPNFDGISLPNLKLTEAGFLKTNKMMQTNISNIYAAGDITGGNLLAHVASKEAEIAVKNMFSAQKENHSIDLIPICIYTYPSFAKIGLSKKQALEQGIKVFEGSYNYMNNSMAKAYDEVSGFIKIFVDEKDKKILGGYVLGEQAVELIMQLAIVLANEMTIADWDEKIMVAHPALSEILHEAIMDADSMSIHKPLKLNG